MLSAMESSLCATNRELSNVKENVASAVRHLALNESFGGQRLAGRPTTLLALCRASVCEDAAQQHALAALSRLCGLYPDALALVSKDITFLETLPSTSILSLEWSPGVPPVLEDAKTSHGRRRKLVMDRSSCVEEGRENGHAKSRVKGMETHMTRDGSREEGILDGAEEENFVESGSVSGLGVAVGGWREEKAGREREISLEHVASILRMLCNIQVSKITSSCRSYVCVLPTPSPFSHVSMCVDVSQTHACMHACVFASVYTIVYADVCVCCVSLRA